METRDATHTDSSGTYVLRELLRDVPLSTDEEGVVAHITCVDAWNGNLYLSLIHI